MSKKTCVIIPCFNVAEAIGNIVAEIKRQALDVIVIDDGSTDSTAEIAEKSQAVILKNTVNRGKGVSLCLGFEYALNNGYETVITMDGDGQHFPGDIADFLRTEKTGAKIIVGNRMYSHNNMPFVRWLTNKIMSKVISGICRQYIPDSQSGFRLIKSLCLKELKLKSKHFEIESEILLEAARCGYKIISIPIKSIYRNSRSRISALADTYRFIKFIVPYLWPNNPIAGERIAEDIWKE